MRNENTGVSTEHAEFGLHDIAVVVPVHNDEECLLGLLKNLKPFSDLQVVVVDSEHNDHLSRLLDCSRYVVSPQVGRGSQIACGISATDRAWIWILHADSRVTASNVAQLELALSRCLWGRFDVRLGGSRRVYRVIEWSMNARSALTGICTGDQGIFVRTKLLQEIGGFPEQRLMEDIELSKRLHKRAKPMRVRAPLESSVRKWESEGIATTILRMWYFRFRYFLGADPDGLHRQYYKSSLGQ